MDLRVAVTSLRDRPVGAVLGLRPPRAQHTQREAEALASYASHRRAAVEIGVAEGMSAAILREAMDATGRLWLIDPYPSRYPVSPARKVARRTISRVRGANVEWIRSFSHDAARGWSQSIDFVFIDADHSEQACEQDWRDWSPWVSPGGVVLFHDSAQGPTSPAQPDWGPVKLVDRLLRNPGAHTPGWDLVDEIDSISVVRRDDCECSSTSLR
jgi:predicted O-methyltransferase YrrM